MSTVNALPTGGGKATDLPVAYNVVSSTHLTQTNTVPVKSGKSYILHGMAGISDWRFSNESAVTMKVRHNNYTYAGDYGAFVNVFKANITGNLTLASGQIYHADLIELDTDVTRLTVAETYMNNSTGFSAVGMATNFVTGLYSNGTPMTVGGLTTNIGMMYIDYTGAIASVGWGCNGLNMYIDTSKTFTLGGNFYGYRLAFTEE